MFYKDMTEQQKEIWWNYQNKLDKLNKKYTKHTDKFTFGTGEALKDTKANKILAKIRQVTNEMNNKIKSL